MKMRMQGTGMIKVIRLSLLAPLGSLRLIRIPGRNLVYVEQAKDKRE